MIHGKRWTFVKYKCRCAECCAANDAYMEAYREKNKAKILAKEKERYQREAEKIMARMTLYYQREKDVVLQRQKEPDKLRRRADTQGRRRARMADADFVEEVLARAILARDQNRCRICGKGIRGPYVIDHLVPLARGGQHVFRNLQLAHPKCNSRKHARLPTLEELEAF